MRRRCTGAETGVAGAPPGGVKPSAVVGALLELEEAEVPVLRVHKVATHFHPPA
jgi:hypothetical protein